MRWELVYLVDKTCLLKLPSYLLVSYTYPDSFRRPVQQPQYGQTLLCLHRTMLMSPRLVLPTIQKAIRVGLNKNAADSGFF